MRDLPLLPLHAVLCPGMALPLHIFEPRYRDLVGECLEAGSPFGVVLIREGREVGPAASRIADVGTTALIREVGRYPDGRMDIVTIGERRFRVRAVDPASASYLVGDVEELGEPIGGPASLADELARRVSGRFLDYLERLQPPMAAPTGPRTGSADAETRPLVGEPAVQAGPRDEPDRHAQLLASARRLVDRGDATAISYLLTGLVQLDLAARQDLLEARDTTSRLLRLDAHLSREQHLVSRGLRPMALDLGHLSQRHN